MTRLLTAVAAALGLLVLTTSAAAVPERALHGKVVVGKDGDGEGRVTSEPDGIDCGSTLHFSFISNDDPVNYKPVTLTARRSPGSAFDGFGSSCGEDDVHDRPGRARKDVRGQRDFRPRTPVAIPTRGDRQREREGHEPAGRDRLRLHVHGAIRNRQHRDA